MTQETNTNRKPAFKLYAVTGEGETSRWIEIGAAWNHRDHQGYAISLDAIPVTGRIVMRANGDTAKTSEAQS